MTQEPALVAWLLALLPGPPEEWVTAKVSMMTPIARGLGVWPETVIARICKPELDILTADLSTILDIHLRVGIFGGVQSDTVEVHDWRIVDIKEASWGSLTPTGDAVPVEWDLHLEDGRWRLTGDRGGALFDGVLNRVDAEGAIIAPVKKNSDLVTLAIARIGGLAYREGLPLSAGLIASLDAFDPPTEVMWRGAHAPTELQRLLEWTRHAFAYNRDGTYSIVKLVDPPTPPTPPAIEGTPLPGGQVTLKPETAGRCIITSAPTRNLIQRNRTMLGGQPNDRPLELVGVDVDGSIRPLTSLTWWPMGKTALHVFKNRFADVAAEHKGLAEASVYRMWRLHDLDRTAGWTLVSRLLDVGSDEVEPVGFLLKSSAAVEDQFGTWANPVPVGVINGANFDLRQGVITTPRPLVRIVEPTKALHEHAVQLSGLQIDFTFCHLPNAGDDTDYFNAVYFVDAMGEVVEDTSPTALADALAEGVPVHRFADLQVHYAETPLTPGPINEVNLAAVKAIALKYAKAIITAQNAKIEVREYPGLHDVDPDGSVNRVVWDGRAIRTVIHMGNHGQITSEYLQRALSSRMARGGGFGVARSGGGGGGLARSAGAPPGGGVSGPSSGARDGLSSASSAAPVPARIRLPWFDAKITSQTGAGTNRWAYGFTEVYKSNTGFGAAQWSNVPGGVVGTAGNRFEIINTGTGGAYLGVGVTNNELNDVGGSPACPLDLRPVPIGMIVQMWPEIVRKADGTVVVEYLFTWANGVYEEP